MDELNITLPILSHYKSFDELYSLDKKRQNKIISSFVKIKPKKLNKQKQLETIDVINAAKILIQIYSN